MDFPRLKEQNEAGLDVLIQGAGIGGLTLAIALQQRGYSVTVVERSQDLSEVGAGIWMAANPMQVFDRLGLAGKVMEGGWLIRHLHLQDSNGDEIQTTDMSKISEMFGFETVALHRAVLQRILFEQLRPGTVCFGREVQSLVQNADSVTVRLSDGSSEETRVVVGADGINSRIRALAGLQGFQGERRYSGSSSYRGIARAAVILPPDEAHDAYEIWAKGCRLGFSRINAADYYWYMTFEAPENESTSSERVRCHAAALFNSFFPQWKSLLDHTHPEEIQRTDISDLKTLPKWSFGRVGLIGDAAHATTPNLGQGGAMAVEDALALAEAFDRDGTNVVAFSSFEQRRREKVGWTVATSWAIGKLCHIGNPLVRKLRNTVLKHTPKSVSEKQIRRLYSLDGM